MRTAPSLRVVTSDPTPPYEQLRRQFVALIATGVLTPGDRLPPLRQLAADLGLAVGTVARTYRELEAAELVVSRRGGGTKVRADLPRPAVGPEQALLDGATAFVREARLLGADDDAIRAAVARAIEASAEAPASVV
jgi:DNA-binding transcriptional regulator YhcF (GntR family)